MYPVLTRHIKAMYQQFPSAPWTPAMEKLKIQQTIDWHLPRKVQFETTNLCNQHCDYCPREEATRGYGLMSWDLFARVVDELAATGEPRHFSLHKDGEPLLHPRVIDMIAYLYRANPHNTLYLTTNGMRLKNDLAVELAKVAPNVLNVSVGAATEESFQKERGAKGLQKVQENVLRFCELRDKYQKDGPRRTTVSVQIVDTHQTHEELDDFIHFWEKTKVDDINVWGKLNWGGAVDDEGAMKKDHRYPCAHLWLYPAVNWDGKVSICAMDWNAENVLGDLNIQTLAEVWQGEAVARYRRLHLGGGDALTPLCAACNAWTKLPDLFFDWQKG